MKVQRPLRSKEMLSDYLVMGVNVVLRIKGESKMREYSRNACDGVKMHNKMYNIRINDKK